MCPVFICRYIGFSVFKFEAWLVVIYDIQDGSGGVVFVTYLLFL